MDAIREQLFERVAQLHALEVPAEQIARVTGLTPARVTELVALPEVAELSRSFAAERLEQQHTVNDGWAAVEEKALGHVLTAMLANPDPEFALRVATMANKAERRGAVHNRSIEPANGARVVVHLHGHFVERLTANHEVQMKPVEKKVEAKRESLMAPGEVSALFRDAGDTVQADVDTLFGVAMTPAEAI